MFAQAFADLALGFSTTFSAPFADATATWPGVPVRDAGGSIVTPAAPIVKTCKAQVSAADEAMRADAGFIEKDMKLCVLSATIDGTLDTSATVEVLAGPHAGRWELHSANLDTAGIGWVCRGRRIP